MGRPGRGGDEIAVYESTINGDVLEFASCEGDLRSAGIVAGTFASFEPAGGREELDAVAHGSNGFAGLREVAYRSEDFLMEAKIFRSAAAGDEQGIVVGRLDVREGGVQGEVVARLLGVGLVSFEVMDGGADFVAGFFAGADDVNLMAHHDQGLIGHHEFVVFNEVTGQTEDLFCAHR